MADSAISAADNEQALKTEGQRHINVLWENTQRAIALSVTLISLLVAAYLAVTGDMQAEGASARTFLFGVANLVIGFYFGRTNHQREGGVGAHAAGR